MSSAGAKRRAVDEFVTDYLEHAATFAPAVGYAALSSRAYELTKQRFASRTTGSMFGGKGATIGAGAREILQRR